MSRIQSFQPTVSSPDSTRGSSDLRDLEVGQFLDLMIAELQNQDPLNPLDNAQMVQQIAQIREISATNQLTETLSAVLTGQNLATASSLIGAEVRALSNGNVNVQGTVNRVTIEADPNGGSRRTPVIHVSAVASGTSTSEDQNAQFRVTAVQPGEDYNGVIVRFVHDSDIEPGQETVSFSNSDPNNQQLVFQIHEGQTTAGDLVAAVQRTSSLAQYFTADLPSTSTGAGRVLVGDATVTSGGGSHAVKLENIGEIIPAPATR